MGILASCSSHRHGARPALGSPPLVHNLELLPSISLWVIAALFFFVLARRWRFTSSRTPDVVFARRFHGKGGLVLWAK